MKIEIEVTGKRIEDWGPPLDVAHAVAEVHKEECADTYTDIVIKGEVEHQGVASVASVAGRNGFYVESAVVGKETTALEFSKRLPPVIPF